MSGWSTPLGQGYVISQNRTMKQESRPTGKWKKEAEREGRDRRNVGSPARRWVTQIGEQQWL